MPFKVVVRKYWRYTVVSLALLVGIALLSQRVFASNSWNQQSVEGAIADTDTDTPTSTSTPTGTVTPSPALLVGHVRWQDIVQPGPRNIQPISLTLSMGGTVIDFPTQNT